MSQEDIDKARAEVEASMRAFAPQSNSQEQPEIALQKVIKESNEILVTASTIGPIHKNALTLTRTKLFGEERAGLGNVSVMSVRIEDVLNVNGEVGPVSGFIEISTKFTSPGKPYRIGSFHRKDVLKLKRIIQGYIIALQKNINTSPIPLPELSQMLYDLGEDDYSIR
jgi:hypothetical protein